MKLNRRNTLIGLGTIVAGGGAALGTGAFSSVEAERDVEIGVAEDSQALLGLVAGSSNFVTEENGILDFEISNVNLDATTTINDAFNIENNSGDAGAAQDITVSIDSFETGGDVGNNGEPFSESDVTSIISFEVDSGSTDLFNGGEITLNDGDPETTNIIIDTEGHNAEGFDGTADLLDSVTFRAERETAE